MTLVSRTRCLMNLMVLLVLLSSWKFKYCSNVLAEDTEYADDSGQSERIFDEFDGIEDEYADIVEYPAQDEYAEPVGAVERKAKVFSMPRDPYTIKLFDVGRNVWRDPIHDVEHANEVDRSFKSAWDESVAIDFEEYSRDGDVHSKRVQARNIRRYIEIA